MILRAAAALLSLCTYIHIISIQPRQVQSTSFTPDLAVKVDGSVYAALEHFADEYDENEVVRISPRP